MGARLVDLTVQMTLLMATVQVHPQTMASTAHITDTPTDIPTVTQEMVLWMQMVQADRETVLKRSLLPPTLVRLPQAEHESLILSSGLFIAQGTQQNRPAPSVEYPVPLHYSHCQIYL